MEVPKLFRLRVKNPIPPKVTLVIGVSLGITGLTAVVQTPSAEAAVIDTLRVWVAPGFGGANPDNLADWFSSVSLWVDKDGDNSVSLVSTGVFNAATDSITTPLPGDDSNIVYEKTGRTYTTSTGAAADIWQVDFKNFGLNLPSQTTYRFGVKGEGRRTGTYQENTNDNKPDFFPWYLLAANPDTAGLGPNAFTDGLYYEYDANGSPYNSPPSSIDGVVNSATNGEWNKTSDILVQVFDNNGNLLTDRGLPSTANASSLVRWAPKDSIYIRSNGNGGWTSTATAPFKGDNFNTVPETSLLFGILVTGLAMLRKKMKQEP